MVDTSVVDISVVDISVVDTSVVDNSVLDTSVLDTSVLDASVLVTSVLETSEVVVTSIVVEVTSGGCVAVATQAQTEPPAPIALPSSPAFVQAAITQPTALLWIADEEAGIQRPLVGQ